MRLVNPQKETYHHELIREFSENSRFISAGSTKGFVNNRYEWFANFANKFNENTSFNAHVANVSFFSDYQVFLSEYANVEQITDEYPFIFAVADSIVSGHDHEMSTKQYFKVSHPYSAFDTIQFLNEAEVLVEDSSYADAIERYHPYYYAPVIFETGYKIDRGELASPDTLNDYNMYIWADRWPSDMFVFDYGFRLELCAPFDDTTSFLESIINQDAGAQRVIDYKVVTTGQESKYLSYDENVYYPFDFVEGRPWSHRQYVGSPILYYAVGSDLFEWEFSSVLQFPQVSRNNVIEPQKTICSLSTYLDENAREHVHASGLSDELDDQSQIVYAISRYQSYWNTSPKYDKTGWPWVGQDTGTEIIEGIDIDVERNRRYSAVVATVPYMTTLPIHNGEVIDYKFVNYDGADLVPGGFPLTNRGLVLKLKASRSYLASLDAELAKREFNIDILHTVSVESPQAFITTDLSASGNYYNFASTQFMPRQEYGVEELIDGIVGVGHRVILKPDFFPTTETGYDSSEGAKVCGMGYYAKTTKEGLLVEYAKLYCSNYKPVDAPSVSTETNTMSVGAANVTVEENELFRPMIKVPGLAGYVKIIRRSPLHQPVQNPDGTFETIYEVEFPFAPGSFQLREALESTYAKTQTFYKSSYINAGSQMADANDHADEYNARFVPEDDKAFSRIKFLYCEPGDVESDTQKDGGGGVWFGSPTARPQNRIVYPGHLVYVDGDTPYTFLTKPRSSVATLERLGGYGTFEMVEDLYTDAKIVWTVDSRVWRYGEEKYSSYINRECPSYTLELDASALSNELGREQYKYGGIPDIKRWIYSKVVSFCGTTIYPSTASDDSHTDGSIDVPTQGSKSDVMVEVWDSAYPIGGSTRAMWRPLTTSQFDTEKSDFSLLLSGAHIESTSLLYTTRAPSVGDPGEGLYSAVVGKFDTETFDEGLVPSEILALDEEDNLVMIYTDDTGAETAYHVAYVDKDDTDSDNVKMTVYALMPLGTTFPTPTYGADPTGWVGPIAISSPYTKVSRSTDFSFNSCKVVGSDVQTRYMDFGDKSSSDSEFNRYVDSNGKIYIRVRPLKGRQYPSAYTEVAGDPDTMQWIESRVTSPFANTNMPWYNITALAFDKLFDWSKVNIRESVRKFGLNYFSLQSK